VISFLRLLGLREYHDDCRSDVMVALQQRGPHHTLPSIERFDRPSLHQPSANMVVSPSFPPRASRPKLRIITTSPVPYRPAIRRPIPIYPPNHKQMKDADFGFAKSAPLFLPAQSIEQSQWKGLESMQMSEDHGGLVVHVYSSPAQPSDTEIIDTETGDQVTSKRPNDKGHKRRLSDKFKSIFSHITRHNPPTAPDHHPLQMSENQARREHLIPTRPPRSPGTASFLVHRHIPSLPASPSLKGSTYSRQTLAPPGYEFSHFSNPTTTSSSATRSLSDSYVTGTGTGMSHSPSGSVQSGKSMVVRGGRVLDKWNGGRWGSMPDLRYVPGMWK